MNDKENKILEKNTLQNQLTSEKLSKIEEKSELHDHIDPKDARILELESILVDMQQRERDYILRTKAELENMRRRNEQDMEKTNKFALEKFMGELLPVIDNLERALNISNKSSDNSLSAIIEGIELTLKSFLDIVRKFGLYIIEDIYVPFNPEIHQAMTVVESEEYIPNQVIVMIQKGYILNGRLIRPAMVGVSKTKN